MDELFEKLQKLGTQSLRYERHPPPQVLRRYVQGKLPERLPSPKTVTHLERGEPEEEWSDVAVAVHVRTCEQCARYVADLHRIRVQNWVERLRERLFPLTAPLVLKPQWAWVTAVGVLFIGLTVGFLMRPLLLPVPKPQISVRSGTIPLDTKAVLLLLQQLQAGKVDLTPFDFNKFFEYETSKGETLKAIAKQHYGDERYWPVLYVLNYNNDLFRMIISKSGDPSKAKLPEGIVLVLVGKRDQKE